MCRLEGALWTLTARDIFVAAHKPALFRDDVRAKQRSRIRIALKDYWNFGGRRVEANIFIFHAVNWIPPALYKLAKLEMPRRALEVYLQGTMRTHRAPDRRRLR